jgi:hypothetical protein
MKTNFNFSLKSLKVEGFEFKGDLGLSIKSEGDTSSITIKADVDKVTYDEVTVECDLHVQFDVETNTKESLVTFNAIHEVMLDPKASLMSSLKDLEERYQIDLNAIRTFYDDPETAIGNLVRYFEGDIDKTPIDLDLEDDEVTGVQDESDESNDHRKITVYINPFFTDNYDDVMGYESKMELPSDSPAIDDIKYHAHYTLQGEGVSRVGIKFHDGSLVLVEPRSLDEGRGRRRRMRRKEENNTRYHYFIGVNNGFLGDDVNQYDTIKFN